MILFSPFQGELEGVKGEGTHPPPNLPWKGRNQLYLLTCMALYAVTQ
jgi:hypothetical protein